MIEYALQKIESYISVCMHAYTEMYLVGGYVRDLLLNRKSHDIDIAMETSFNDMLTFINQHGTVFVKKEQFGTIRSKIGNTVYDFSICRKDGAYSDHRHPNDITVGTIYDDLSRRDFTINAMAIPVRFLNGDNIDYSLDNIIDPFNGQTDIQNRIIRCVGNTDARLNEDPLRLLRAVRFSIILGFELDASIIKCLHDGNMINCLQYVSSERIIDELTKCFAHDTLKTLNVLGTYSELKTYIFSNINGLWLKPTNKQRN